MLVLTLWPLPSAFGVWRSGYSLTSAKVQKKISRCKSGGNSEQVGSCPPLTDFFLTYSPESERRELVLFKII